MAQIQADAQVLDQEELLAVIAGYGAASLASDLHKKEPGDIRNSISSLDAGLETFDERINNEASNRRPWFEQ